MVAALFQAWRSWKSAPAVAALAALAFAVGIGSVTAIYTVVHGVMLKPLPYRDGDRFVALYGAAINEPGRRSAHNVPDLLEYQQRTRSFDVFGWFRPRSYNMTFGGQVQHVNGASVTTSLAHNLGVQPAIGRWFENDQEVVISSALWTRLGADAAIVGKPLSLDGRTFTVTGVMPSWFRLPVSGPGVEVARSDVWTALDPRTQDPERHEGFHFCYAHLKPGVTFEQAQDDVSRVAAEIAALDPAAHPAYTAKLDGLRESVIMAIKPTLLLLVAAAGLLLLITCADVAGLLLARAVARARETALRVALGASLWQLGLHYLVEGLVVSLAGAAAGVLLSVLLVRVVVSMAAEYIPRADEISIDWTVVAFSLAAALLSSTLAALAPLWQALRTTPTDVLNEGVRASAGARSRRLSESLVVAEIALAFTLLAVSAILIVHLRNLARVNPGFDASNLLTFDLATAERQDMTTEMRAAVRERWAAALEAIPGVTSAGFANQTPIDGCCLSTTIYPEGIIANSAEHRTSFMAIDAGYLRTMRIPLRSGRFLDDRDMNPREGEITPVLINEAASAAYWQGRNPLNSFVRLNGPEGHRAQVVGVVGNVRNDGLGKPTVPEVYLAHTIAPVNPLGFVIRSGLPPAALTSEVRRAVQTVDPTQPIYGVATMDDIVRGSLSFERIGSFMVTFFALAALLMATLGIYGVVSYGVRRNTTEIGTRMALGAIGRDLLLMIVGRGVRMSAYGAAIGAVAVIAATWILVRVFEIRDLGVLPFAASTVTVALVAAGASFFPGWRATRLSPMVAIRNDTRLPWRPARESLRQLFTSVSRAIAIADDVPAVPSTELLTEFVAAARSAGSFNEAFRLALTTLCNRLGASSALLLERGADAYRPISAFPDRSVDATLPSAGFLVNRFQSYSHPLPFSAADLESWRRWAREHSPHHLAEFDALECTGATIAVALHGKGEILGLLLVGRPQDRDGYSDSERAVLQHCGEQLTLMIENARLTGRVVEQEKLRRDLALAAEVQKRLLPDAPPEATAAVLSALSVPARSIGGDYYDFLDLGDQRIGIALADIAGKGIAAALIMAVVQASLRIVASDGEASLPQLAARMNDLLHRSTKSKSYATFFYGQLDERNKQLRYVNAGHNPPYLIRALDVRSTGAPEIQELSVGGTVLGLFPEMDYQEGTVHLRSGDVLVAFTDGVTEALNAKEEEFGEERLKTVLRDALHLPANDISKTIAEALRAWIKDTDQYDDLTFIVLKVT
jgi:putative ABC transport system permease protein